MSEYDFKGALKGLHDLNKNMGFINPNSHYGKHCAAVDFALRLANRIQSGEVSDEMINAGSCASFGAFCKPTNCYEAMTAQLMKEVKDEH